MQLCEDRRGDYKDMKYMGDRVDIHYVLPMGEIVYDFFDALKSRTKGYASYDYEPAGYQKSNLVKLDVMLAGDTEMHFLLQCIRLMHIHGPAEQQKS